MSTRYPHAARQLWSLMSSGTGTTLTAAGNSGPYVAGPGPQTAIDLREITDVWLAVAVNGTVSGTGPSLVVNLDVYDADGNVYPAILSTAAITATATSKTVSGGMHGGSGASIIFPSFGRLSWTVGTGTPSFAKVSISLYGR